MRNRSYSELQIYKNFYDRFEYLKLSGFVGEETFGFDRFLNQQLYRSREWRKARDAVIIRDNGCDMGIEDYIIGDRIVVHHMNPITLEDIETGADVVYDPEFLICVSFNTHNAIHYGDVNLLPQILVERKPNDTIPWR